MSSYVYVIENNSEYKIGKSDNPKARLSGMQTGNTDQLTLLLTIEFRDSVEAFRVEAELHGLFKHLRIRGEWFKLTIKELLQIKSLHPSFVRKQLSHFERHILISDFIDQVVAMSNNERTVMKLIKDDIRWDKTLNSYGFIVKLPPESLAFDPAVDESMLYSTFLKGFKLLHKKDLVRRVRKSEYMFNPEFFILTGEQVPYFQRLWDESKPYKDNA